MILESARSALDALPLSGWKTKIGLIIALLSALISAISLDDINQLITLLKDNPINYVALAFLILGIIHKWLKAAYPNQAPQNLLDPVTNPWGGGASQKTGQSQKTISIEPLSGPPQG